MKSWGKTKDFERQVLQIASALSRPATYNDFRELRPPGQAGGYYLYKVKSTLIVNGYLCHERGRRPSWGCDFVDKWAGMVGGNLTHFHRDNGSKGMAQFQEAGAFFQANRTRLLREYRGKYVAILNGGVIDSDVDFSHLAERVFRREGVRDIFMPKVEEDTEVVSIPSPQFKGQ